jgi:hypothetical protein
MQPRGRDCFASRVVKVSAGARIAALLSLVALLAACSSTHSAAEQSDAQRLVSATQAAGVAPGLTVEIAESLYGTSAPQICDALDGGVNSSEALLLAGNSSGRRGKLVTTDAITYERIVVQTYCPDQLSNFNDLVSDINATKTTR